jgi:hypothetical protein
MPRTLPDAVCTTAGSLGVVGAVGAGAAPSPLPQPTNSSMTTATSLIRLWPIRRAVARCIGPSLLIPNRRNPAATA